MTAGPYLKGTKVYTQAMKRIMVQRNPRKFSIVDDLDFEQLSKYRWRVCGGSREGGYYAARMEGPKTIYMHRELLSPGVGEEIDHRNRNRLDNRRANLHIVDSRTNKLNTKLRSDNTTGHKGLRWREDVKRWRVNVKVYGKEIQIGYFIKKRDAIKARKAAELKYYGIL